MSDNRLYIVLRGGTEGDRKRVVQDLGNISKKDDVDINLLNLGDGGELKIRIKTACGEVSLDADDLESDTNVIENACGKIKCRIEKSQNGENASAGNTSE